MEQSIENIEILMAPTVEALGCRIWGVELQGGFKNNLKVVVYIDSEKGISVDDCAVVSEHVSDILDMEELVPSPYVLEVSSPGMDRLLFSETHYNMYLGELVEVKLIRKFEGQRNFEGLLKGNEAGCVVIEVRDEEYLFPIEDIDKIRIVPVFE